MSNKNEARKERYIGFYLDTELCDKLIALASSKTIKTGVRHSQSDILRLAVCDILKKNGLIVESEN